MEFFTAYGPKRKVGLLCSDESRTKQSMKEECDINFIVNRFASTGNLSHVRDNPGEFADYGDELDYHEAMTLVVKADQMFDSMPSVVREKFANDPGLFLKFVNDKTNVKEMKDLGLLRPDYTDPVIGKVDPPVVVKEVVPAPKEPTK